MTDREKAAEQLFKNYSLRVAIACVLGAMPRAQRQKAKAAMAQHVLAIEEAAATGLPGAAELAATMTTEFDSLEKAAAIEVSFIATGHPGTMPKRSAPAKPAAKKEARGSRT